MKWIPVEEQMPENKERVLTYAPLRFFPIDIHIYRNDYAPPGTWWIGSSNFLVEEGDITHWMPLPEEVSK